MWKKILPDFLCQVSNKIWFLQKKSDFLPSDPIDPEHRPQLSFAKTPDTEKLWNNKWALFKTLCLLHFFV